MSEPIHEQIFYADGKAACGERVAAVIRRAGFHVTCFQRISNCLRTLESYRCDLLVSNVRRPAVEGMRLLLGARSVVSGLPVVMLVDRGDIGTAVRAMKAGAAGCLERPPETPQLLAAVHCALDAYTRAEILLSPTERRVLGLILQGRSTRDTAAMLKRSVRTVEVHRRNIMRKFGAKNVVELVKKCVCSRLSRS